MQTAKQLSVSLVNKPGRLAAMLTALSKNKVGFQALAVMDSGDRGTVRFVPEAEQYAGATEVLDKLNVRYDESEILLVEVPNQAGAFRKICERLAGEHLNIDYAYSSFAERSTKGGGLAVIKVNNLAKAQKVLAENGSPMARRKLPVRRPSRAAVRAR
jgi:hypothetical protein